MPTLAKLEETTQVTAMQIARLALGGDLGETVCDQILDQLDMTHTEANKVWLELAHVLQMQD